MKIAELPTGELIKFSPDTPDDEIDRQVRAKLGIPEPMTETQMVMQAFEQFAAQQQSFLENQMLMFQHLSAQQAQLTAQLTALADAQSKMVETNSAQVSALVSAVTAPKKITLPGGRVAGVQLA